MVVILSITLSLLLARPAMAAGDHQTLGRTPPPPEDVGWMAVEEERFGDALEAFTEAARQQPRNPTASLGAGLAAFMLGRSQEAREWLERALRLNPRLTDASILLGEVHYRAGDVPAAIDVYESALKYAPEDDELQKGLDRWRKESTLHGRFYQAQGAHFSVLFEGPADERLAGRAVELLEAAYWRVGSALGTYPTREITVVLYTDEQFRDITRSPAWAGGVYDGRIKVPTRGALNRPDELERVLVHELVHAIVATLAGPTVPVWINEGLATVLEPGGLEWSEEQLAGDPERVPAAQLRGSFGRFSAPQARAAYAQSAKAVKKMLDLRGASALVTLLQALGRGTPFEAAFHQSMSMRVEDFETSLASR